MRRESKAGYSPHNAPAADEVGAAGAVVLRIPDVPLPAKLSIIGAALQAIREAHRDTMSARAWSEINKAEEAIAAAMLHANEGRLITG